MTEAPLGILCGQNNNVFEEMRESSIIFRQEEVAD